MKMARYVNKIDRMEMHGRVLGFHGGEKIWELYLKFVERFL